MIDICVMAPTLLTGKLSVHGLDGAVCKIIRCNHKLSRKASDIKNASKSFNYRKSRFEGFDLRTASNG